MEDPFATFEHDPREPAYADLRASDRDRDRLLPVLTDAYADGRLTREEYDDRSDRLGRARILGDLPPVVADLVATIQPRHPAVPARRSDLKDQAAAYYVRQRREAVWSALSASLICLVIWAVVSGGFFWPGFVILGTGLNVGRLLMTRDDVVEDRLTYLEKKEAKRLRAERRQLGPGET